MWMYKSMDIYMCMHVDRSIGRSVGRSVGRSIVLSMHPSADATLELGFAMSDVWWWVLA